jgi:hypothetical protein
LQQPFSIELALRCAELIRAAYQRPQDAALNVPRTDTQIHLVRVNGVLFVVFPGTASGRDVVTDLRCAKLKWSGHGRIHAGFRSAFNSFAQQLEAELETRLCTQIVFTGHSLGGALAMLAARWLLTRYPSTPTSVITFGQPRVGNWVFSLDYNAELGDRTFRVVNRRDPVPKIPWQFGTYRHCGTEVYLRGVGDIQIQRPWYRRIADTIEEAQALQPLNPENSRFISFSAHSLASYIEKLQGARSAPGAEVRALANARYA